MEAFCWPVMAERLDFRLLMLLDIETKVIGNLPDCSFSPLVYHSGYRNLVCSLCIYYMIFCFYWQLFEAFGTYLEAFWIYFDAFCFDAFSRYFSLYSSNGSLFFNTAVVFFIWFKNGFDLCLIFSAFFLFLNSISFISSYFCEFSTITERSYFIYLS